MRPSSRKDTHLVACYRYRAYLEQRPSGRLPDAVYAHGCRQLDYWNAMVARLAESKIPAHESAEQKRERWAAFEAWARQTGPRFGLGWVDGPHLRDRFYAALKRAKSSGAGLPAVRHRLENFSIAHRYTNGGVESSKLFSDAPRRVSLGCPPAGAYATNSRDNRRARFVRGWFRVDAQDLPLWVVLHREIPDAAIVKRVALCGELVPALGWKLHLVVTCEIPRPAPSVSAEQVGIDVGWRKLGDELRVAVGFDGRMHTELRIPLAVTTPDFGIVGLQRIEDLQTWRDRMLEQTKQKLKSALAAIPAGFAQMRHLGLRRLDSSLPEASPARPLLAAWRRDDLQIARKLRMIERRLRGRRDHAYQNWAAALVRRYGTIRVESLDLPQLYASQNQADYALKAAARYRGYASCGRLIAFLRNAARRSGVTFELIEAAHTTDVCARCAEPFEAGAQLLGRCASGHQADQDWNAAENIYANRGGLAAGKGSAKKPVPQAPANCPATA